jgi:5-methyltetrahydrofolate--homocysteine methyltransferase
MAYWDEFNEQIWQNLEETWNKWWLGELDRPIIFLETAPQDSNISLSSLYPQLTQYSPETPVDSVILKMEDNFRKINYLGDAFPKWWPNLGAGFLAAMLGSQIEFNTGNTWFHPSKSLDLLSQPIDTLNPWWQWLEKLINAAHHRWQGKLILGYTDIGGNLDILSSLIGSNQLLLKLADNPVSVENSLQLITERWLEFFDIFDNQIPASQNGRTCWAPIWCPGTGYMLQCDFSIMISSKMFQKFVLPDLEACCETIEYPFYHLDGPGATRHLDTLLSIEKLRGIQWVPGAGAPPAEDWLQLLEKIRTADKLCQVFVTSEGAIKIAKALGGKGFVFCIVDDRLPTPKEGYDFLDQIGSI